MVNNTLADKLKEAAVVAHDLGNEYDGLTAPIDRIEDALKRLNLGVTAETEIAPGLFLGYDRIDTKERKWGLTISFEDPKEMGANPADDPASWWPWRSAPRKYRLQSIGAFPDLIDALVVETRKVAEEVRSAAVKAQDFANALVEGLR